MLYMFTAKDAPNSAEKRAELRVVHRARLIELSNQDRLAIAGPLYSDENQEVIEGSLIIAEFDSIEQAKNWIDRDPYTENHVYATIDIKPFKQILP